jgi:hypothetical protein
MASIATSSAGAGFIHRLNGRQHRAALNIYLFIVIAHWAEHLVQAYQIWVLGWPRPEARGLLGQPFPWLVEQEWLHWGYALIMLIGLFLLRPGFVGRGRTWWMVALVLQFWHHIEHLLLFIQAQTGVYYFGGSAPTSIAQLVLARVELHLFYNSIVFIPMIIAMYLHVRPNSAELANTACSCVAHQKVRTGDLGTPAPNPV